MATGLKLPKILRIIIKLNFNSKITMKKCKNNYNFLHHKHLQKDLRKLN